MFNTPVIIHHLQDMISYGLAARGQERHIGLVPTMGALHEGHLSLVDYARPRCECLVVSIFLNPLQFNNQEDLDTYPRTWEHDLALCTGHEVDVVFAPRPEDMYPAGYQTRVRVEQLSMGLCGDSRPGHFDGVATVVLKLFNATFPHLAVFGEKDFQQLRLVQRMALDLNLTVAVEGRPTVRESDGLALSSRNEKLDSKERERALCLWRGLNAAHRTAQAGEQDTRVLLARAKEEIAKTPGTKLEYVEVVDEQKLTRLTRLDRPARMCMAVWVGSTRLIDNIALP